MDGVILTGIKALGAYSQLLSDKNSGLEDSSEQMVQDVSLIRKDIDQLTHLSGELKGMEKQLNQEMGALYKKEMRQSKLLNQMKDRISRLSNEVKD